MTSPLQRADARNLLIILRRMPASTFSQADWLAVHRRVSDLMHEAHETPDTLPEKAGQPEDTQ